jgi:hypothetical protein
MPSIENIQYIDSASIAVLTSSVITSTSITSSRGLFGTASVAVTSSYSTTSSWTSTSSLAGGIYSPILSLGNPLQSGMLYLYDSANDLYYYIAGSDGEIAINTNLNIIGNVQAHTISATTGLNGNT